VNLVKGPSPTVKAGATLVLAVCRQRTLAPSGEGSTRDPKSLKFLCLSAIPQTSGHFSVVRLLLQADWLDLKASEHAHWVSWAVSNRHGRSGAYLKAVLLAVPAYATLGSLPPWPSGLFRRPIGPQLGTPLHLGGHFFHSVQFHYMSPSLEPHSHCRVEVYPKWGKSEGRG
jgi:hypothetical protein